MDVGKGREQDAEALAAREKSASIGVSIALMSVLSRSSKCLRIPRLRLLYQSE